MPAQRPRSLPWQLLNRWERAMNRSIGLSCAGALMLAFSFSAQGALQDEAAADRRGSAKRPGARFNTGHLLPTGEQIPGKARAGRLPTQSGLVGSSAHERALPIGRESLSLEKRASSSANAFESPSGISPIGRDRGSAQRPKYPAAGGQQYGRSKPASLRRCRA
jgi:hypothetical protein